LISNWVQIAFINYHDRLIIFHRNMKQSFLSKIFFRKPSSFTYIQLSQFKLLKHDFIEINNQVKAEWVKPGKDKLVNKNNKRWAHGFC
jgi:hypothetical protein